MEEVRRFIQIWVVIIITMLLLIGSFILPALRGFLEFLSLMKGGIL